MSINAGKNNVGGAFAHPQTVLSQHSMNGKTWGVFMFLFSPAQANRIRWS